jgi:hypothetical protein
MNKALAKALRRWANPEREVNTSEARRALRYITQEHGLKRRVHVYKEYHKWVRQGALETDHHTPLAMAAVAQKIGGGGIDKIGQLLNYIHHKEMKDHIVVHGGEAANISVAFPLYLTLVAAMNGNKPKPFTTEEGQDALHALLDAGIGPIAINNKGIHALLDFRAHLIPHTHGRFYLHRENGPAIHMGNGGPKFYFWRGTRMREKHVTHPEVSITHGVLTGEGNENRLKSMLDIIGVHGILGRLSHKIVEEAEDEEFRFQLIETEPLKGLGRFNPLVRKDSECGEAGGLAILRILRHFYDSQSTLLLIPRTHSKTLEMAMDYATRHIVDQSQSHGIQYKVKVIVQ